MIVQRLNNLLSIELYLHVVTDTLSVKVIFA